MQYACLWVDKIVQNGGDALLQRFAHPVFQPLLHEGVRRQKIVESGEELRESGFASDERVVSIAHTQVATHICKF
jgi:hypothetical protein